jgi:phosphomannomutase
MMLVLQVMELEGRPLSELWRPVRRYSQSGEVNRTVADVATTLERVGRAFPDAQVDHLDGLTVSLPDWWFNLRPSNTEPLVRLNVEASSEEETALHRDEVLALIDS